MDAGNAKEKHSLGSVGLAQLSQDRKPSDTFMNNLLSPMMAYFNPHIAVV